MYLLDEDLSDGSYSPDDNGLDSSDEDNGPDILIISRASGECGFEDDYDDEGSFAEAEVDDFYDSCADAYAITETISVAEMDETLTVGEMDDTLSVGEVDDTISVAEIDEEDGRDDSKGHEELGVGAKCFMALDEVVEEGEITEGSDSTEGNDEEENSIHSGDDEGESNIEDVGGDVDLESFIDDVTDDEEEDDFEETNVVGGDCGELDGELEDVMEEDENSLEDLENGGLLLIANESTKGAQSKPKEDTRDLKSSSPDSFDEDSDRDKESPAREKTEEELEAERLSEEERKAREAEEEKAKQMKRLTDQLQEAMKVRGDVERLGRAISKFVSAGIENEALLAEARRLLDLWTLILST